ncbi:MAG: patatin-like phospholipase family protein, partial [Chloroflexi bacterium]|nr:patatin-like phospholipase family protein [Chloroflexota bacterium]
MTGPLTPNPSPSRGEGSLLPIPQRDSPPSPSRGEGDRGDEGEPGHQRRSALLDGLPPEERDQVETRLTPVFCAAGTVLVAQGSWHGAMYIIRSGVLGVAVATFHGETRQVARLVPGDCIGEMSLLTGSPASATVTALVDSELWALGHVEFLELLSSCPTLARNMAIILSRRLSIANRTVEPDLVRWMRLRVHPRIPPGLPEAIARAVSSHLAIPLVVLDQRPAGRWFPTEQLPPAESAVGDHRVADRLRPTRPPGVFAISTSHASRDTTVHLQEWIAGHVLHVLTVLETDGQLGELDGRHEQPRADLTLWPAGETALPADVADVALVTPQAQSSSRRALDRASREHEAHVVRILASAGRDQAAHVAWLGRHLAGLKVGVALGGGGARGYAHLGVLAGLQRSAVPVDYLGGCSIGALVASGLAFGLSLDAMQRELDAAPPYLRKFTVSRASLLSERGLEYLFRDRLFGDSEIEDLPIPLAIVAVDVLQRHKVVMERGLMWKALRATTAIPGIYPPVWIGGHCLVDGGILDPVPADLARAL